MTYGHRSRMRWSWARRSVKLTHDVSQRVVIPPRAPFIDANNQRCTDRRPCEGVNRKSQTFHTHCLLCMASCNHCGSLFWFIALHTQKWAQPSLEVGTISESDDLTVSAGKHLIHYRKIERRRVQRSLPCAIYRAHGKKGNTVWHDKNVRQTLKTTPCVAHGKANVNGGSVVCPDVGYSSLPCVRKTHGDTRCSQRKPLRRQVSLSSALGRAPHTASISPWAIPLFAVCFWLTAKNTSAIVIYAGL